jgi:hypothetical protein
MATGKFLFSFDAKANADLSAKRGYAMKLTAADVVDVPSAATDLAIGVLINNPLQNQTAEVMVLGIATVWADGTTAISVNDRLGTNNSGVWVKKATADYNAGGIALDALASGTGFIRMLLIPGGMFRTLLG